MPLVQCASSLVRCGCSLTVAHILHRPVLTNVDVQPVRLVVHGHHAVGLEHAVLLGEVLLCEGLFACVSVLLLSVDTGVGLL